MRKILKSLIIIIILTFLTSINVKAENITDINDLVENSKELDTKEVTVTGEVIGERMDRGNNSWVNINDGTNAIGIWISKMDVEKINNYGNYDYEGDTVKITGTFNRACKEHGGEADLHNKSIEIIEDGHLVKEEISFAKIMIAAVLSIITLVMSIIYIKVIRK